MTVSTRSGGSTTRSATSGGPSNETWPAFSTCWPAARVVVDDLVDEVVTARRRRPRICQAHRAGRGRPKGALVIEYGGARGARDPCVTCAGCESPPRVRPHDRSTIGLGSDRGPGTSLPRSSCPRSAEAGARLEVVGGGSGPSAEAALAGRWLRPAWRRRPRTVITDKAVDVVAICTRHATHAELTRQALEAGKHVFCEKPLALALDELSDVVAAARSSRGLLLVGFNRRFSPFLSEARSFLAAAGTPVTALPSQCRQTLAYHWTHDLSQGSNPGRGVSLRGLPDVPRGVADLIDPRGSPPGPRRAGSRRR